MYYVSDRGRVISKSTHRINQIEHCLVETNNGYFRVSLRNKHGVGRYYLIHRIVMIEFNPIPNYKNLQVNHIDGNKANNCLWNLEWVTGSQNIKHAYITGLKSQYHGEDCSCSTITNEQAENIAQLLVSQKYTHQEISNIIGCPVHIVSSISTGTTWKDIHNKYNLDNYKKQFVLRLNDNQLHQLFKYFEDHRYIQYRYKSDLYRSALLELFGIEMTQSMTATLSRLYNRQTRRDISDQYIF